MSYPVANLTDGTILDTNDERCPEEVINLLEQAGVSYFDTRGGVVNWEVIRQDAQILLARLGNSVPSGEEKPATDQK